MSRVCRLLNGVCTIPSISCKLYAWHADTRFTSRLCARIRHASRQMCGVHNSAQGTCLLVRQEAVQNRATLHPCKFDSLESERQRLGVHTDPYRAVVAWHAAKIEARCSDFFRSKWRTRFVGTLAKRGAVSAIEMSRLGNLVAFVGKELTNDRRLHHLALLSSGSPIAVSMTPIVRNIPSNLVNLSLTDIGHISLARHESPPRPCHRL